MFVRNNSNFKIILFIILAVFSIWAIFQIKEIAMLFFASYVLACSLNPFVDKMSTKIPRGIATTIAILVSGFLLLLVLLPVITNTINELKTLFYNIPSIYNKFDIWIHSTSIMGHNLSDFINIDNQTISQEIGKAAETIFNQSYKITMGFLDGITVILSILMVVFYLILEKKEINENIIKLFPPKIKKKAQHIINCIEYKVGGYIFAQILSMSTVAFFTFLGLALLKVDYALLLGVIAGLLDIVPIIGPTIALVLGVTAASTKGLLWVVLTIVVYLLGQWLSNQLVRPLVFGKFLQLHPIIVLFSFLIAAKILGVWGVILAPAIAAMILTLFDELYIKTINAKGKSFEE